MLDTLGAGPLGDYSNEEFAGPYLPYELRRMAVTPLPTPPSRSDTTDFAERADDFLGALPTFGTELTATANDVSLAETNSYANYAAFLAQSSSPVAKGTSITNLTIGTGSKLFVTQSGKGFIAGQPVICSSAANRAKWMWGLVASYSSTDLTVTVSLIGGSGTAADWDILIASPTGRVVVTDFTTSGNWAKNPAARAITVQVLGAGGGGGGCYATTGRPRGGGGGGGAYVEAFTVGPGSYTDVVAVTVGAVGSAGAASGGNGGNGGSSSFGAYVVAYGGGGGGGISPDNTNGDGGGGGGGGGLAGAGVAGVAGGTAAGVGGNGGNGGAGVAGGTGGVGGVQDIGGSVETKLYAGAGGAAGMHYVTDASGRNGGGAMHGGGGGGGGTGAASGASRVGGSGGASLFAGHGGAGGGPDVATGAVAGTSGGLNTLVGTSGGSPLNADGTAGGVGCGGGAGGSGSTTARAGGAGGRGHVRVIEFL